MSNVIEVDSRQVLRTFSDLTSKQQKKVYRDSLRKAANILTKETRKNLKGVVKSITSKNRWNGKTLSSGVKVKVDREATEAKVHIMGDFRLKFLELGTSPRYLRKNNAYRGKNTASYFFRRAKNSKEGEVFNKLDNLITQSIQRVANGNRNR